MVWNYRKLEEEYKKSTEIIEEALKACDEYNWHELTSMRFALDNIKKILKKA